MPRQSRLERRLAKIEDRIDARIAAIDKALDLGDPRPFGAKKLSQQERLDYFASLPDEQKMEKWLQMEPDEQAEIQQGMMQMMAQGQI